MPANKSDITARLSQKAEIYIRLTRLNRPIGIYLVLWPTLWALWLAADGLPDIDLLVIFTLGTILMRSAGCVINDFADRQVDGHVKRTEARPIITGEVSPKEALAVFAALTGLAFMLVLLTNQLTVYLSAGAVALAALYPFMKRFTHLPQVVLGAAFAWSIPMAFAAQTNSLPSSIWLVYTTVVVWTVSYDTFYAMVDRDDDIKIGVKSTAVLFGENDRMIIGSLQIFTIVALMMMGSRFGLQYIYQTSVVIAAGFFAYQQYSTRNRERDKCFTAFLNNNYVGMVIFAGIALDLAFMGADTAA